MISTKKLIFILTPFILLVVLIFINGIMFSSVARTESVWIDSPILGEKVYGTIYHPRNPHPSHPIVIAVHGITQESSVDMRMPLELTKRGFYVLSIDQSGHGLTYGSQPGLEDDVLKPFFFRNIIGVVDYIYSRKSLFNVSALGCVGFSLGGWTTLMGTVIEPRINASVSWAGPTNITDLDADFSTTFRNIGVTPENNFFSIPELQRNHSVVEYWDGFYGNMTPKNTLLIHGTNDNTVPVRQAIDAYNLVNDSTKCELVLIEGADHAIINNIAVNETIAWFETKLLGGIQGPLEFSQFTYIPFYVTYLLMLLCLYSSVFGIGFSLFKVKERYVKPPDDPITNVKSEGKTYKTAFLNLILYSLPVLGIWVGLYYIQSLICDYLITILLGALFLIIYEVIFLVLKSRDSFTKHKIKQTMKAEFGIYGIIIVSVCAVYFVGFYAVLSYSFKFLMFVPRSIELYFLSLFALLPFFLTYEIFQRKLIQDQFPRGTERKKFVNRIVLFGFTAISFFPLYYISSGSFFSVLIVIVFMIAVTTISIYLYEKTHSVFTTALFNTIVCAFFLAHCYFLFL